MAKKIVTERKLINAIDKYKKQLYNNPKVSPTRFNHMQTALYGVKCLIWDLHGSPRKSEMAQVK